MKKINGILASFVAAAVLASSSAAAQVALAEGISVGPRPLYLIDKMADGELKRQLLNCSDKPVKRTNFSIGHRGAPLMFPEHTVESNIAAARMGAGILECDVTFTKDHELVCRHAQNDLHTTTDILLSDLADACITPFAAAAENSPAVAECRTSEITLAEFKTLTPKMDAADDTATTPKEYQGGIAGFRTNLYTEDDAALLTHAESINLFKSLGAKFTPELKSPAVDMPHNGFSMDDYAQKMIDEYKAAGINPSDVFVQSFDLDVIRYWIKAEPEFGRQAVYLVSLPDGFDGENPETWQEDFAALKAEGVNYFAPPMNMLVSIGDNGKIVASAYAKAAKAAGLKLISWTLERSGPLTSGGGWYYSPLNDIIKTDGQVYELVDALAQEVGIIGLFSDWPGTVSYYASCMGLN